MIGADRASGWVVEARQGDAAALHGPWPPPDQAGERRLAVCRVVGPTALVLGSAQGRDRARGAESRAGARAGEGPAESGSAETGSAETGSAESGSAETGSAETGSAETGSAETGSAETGSAESGSAEIGGADSRVRRDGFETGPPDGRDRAGGTALALVCRRGGGGAVLVEPGAQVWIDVWVPRGDPLWDDDVVRGASWLGHAWAAALADIGLPGLVVHEGRSLSAPWSESICFAGVGPGEVLVDHPPAKVVGLTQHRSRNGARMATMAHARWKAGVVVAAAAEAGLVPGRDLGAAAAAVAGRAVGVLDLLARAGVALHGGILSEVEAAVVRRITST